eukprot:s731_g23.t1
MDPGISRTQPKPLSSTGPLRHPGDTAHVAAAVVLADSRPHHVFHAIASLRGAVCENRDGQDFYSVRIHKPRRPKCSPVLGPCYHPGCVLSVTCTRPSRRCCARVSASDRQVWCLSENCGPKVLKGPEGPMGEQETMISGNTFNTFSVSFKVFITPELRPSRLLKLRAMAAVLAMTMEDDVPKMSWDRKQLLSRDELNVYYRNRFNQAVEQRRVRMYALQGELAAPWKSPGFRAAANDLIVSAVRGVKSLRDLSVSVFSAEQSRAAGKTELGKPAAAQSSASRHSGSDRPKLPPPPPAPKVEKEASSSEEDDEEDEEEEDETKDFVRGASAKANPGHRPPEPDHPPPGRSEGHHRSSHHQRDRSRSETRKRKKKRGDGGKSRGNRGGAKHQRVHRRLEQPDLRLHTRAHRSYWEGERSFAGPVPRREYR